MAIKTIHNKPQSSDNFRSIVSAYVKGSNGDGDYVVFEVPRNALVTIKAVDIKTAYSGTSTGTLTVGYKENGGALQAAGLVADTVILSEATGVKSVNVCKHFPKGGIVTLGVTKGDSSANIVARIYAEYSVVYVQQA